jgi:integrase/recombinase XerC
MKERVRADRVFKYAAGEKLCAGCKEPLPALETWPGRIVIYCGKPDCQHAARNHPTRRYVGEGEIKCQARGCEKFIPAGSYDSRHMHFVCSGECWHHRRAQAAMGNKLVTCGCGCGQQFRSGKASSKNFFVNREHAGRYRTDQLLKRCGPFLSISREYLEGFAQLHYTHSSQGTARISLALLCEFLIVRNITVLEDVVPKTITDFLIWGRDHNRGQVAHSVSSISTFFNWMIAQGTRKAGNPVVPSIHKTRHNEPEPRPLSHEELEFAWGLLEKRGNARIRLAMAIGEEAGLRISEIANVRLEDVDQIKQRIHVRKPTKTRRTRTVPFGRRTSKYLSKWLKERDPYCGHDHLFHGSYGKPSTAQSLRDEFNRFLTKRGSTYHNGHQTNPDGFDIWSTHRLRHTMASNLVNGGADAATVMAVGGWSTPKSMSVYSRVDPSVAQRGYAAAMSRAKEQQQQKKPAQRVSLEQFAQRRTQSK